ncbi:MAG: hypothetical protein ACF8SC_02885 [Phycisphaerales bacterium JB037]
MHDNDAQGNDFFKCDYCLSGWSEDRPMVEGHRGSLICIRCLAMATREVLEGEGGVGASSGVACRLCLQTNDVRHWQSPMEPEAYACIECIARCGQMLAKDPDIEWPPAKASS